jgi:DNA modification methylase
MKIFLNKIYNEDCLTGMQRIDANSIDCILTDTPERNNLLQLIYFTFLNWFLKLS